MSDRMTAGAEAALPWSLATRVAHFARERPTAVGLREKRLGIWQETSWADYYANIEATARALWEIGIRPGDHVAIISDNRTEWLYADLAVQAIGARSVGIYQTNPPADVAYVLNDCGAKLLFCEDQEQVDKAIEIAADTPSVERIVVFDPRGTRDYDDPRLRRWSDFIGEGRSLLEDSPDWLQTHLAQLDPEAPAMVVYTSGTTGNPKGAMLSNANVAAIAASAQSVFGATAEDSLLSYLPLCHVAEKIFTLFFPLQVGAVVHFGESIATVREDLADVSPTIFLGVPRIWEKIHALILLRMQNASWLKRTLFRFFSERGRGIAARRRAGRTTLGDRLIWFVGDLLIYRPLQERFGLRRCRLPVVGAAPVSKELLEWFHGVGIQVTEGYGQTECTGVSHTNPPNAIRIGTVGQPLEGVECRIAADGEILVRGGGVFCGYHGRKSATAEVITADGWLATGDLGAVDSDGYLTITGRKKEIIITAGGKNLSPEKIENALKISTYIKEAVAIGDRRKFIAALLQPDYDAVGDWASRRGIAFSTYADLITKPEVEKLIAGEVERGNDRLAQVEQVRAFRFFPKELHQDDGELTPTQKVRRRAVVELYDALIESAYGKAN